MPFNGSGTYSLPAGNPVVTGTTISSSTTNNTNTDIATALTNCLTRDGQSTPSANLPMNAMKLTGLAAGTSNGDSVRYEQLTAAAALFLPLAGGTMTGAITFASGQVFLKWIYKNATYDPALVGDAILADTSGGAFTITLPASPATNDYVAVADYAGTFSTSALTINPNGLKIMGTVQNLELNVAYRNVTLVYTGSTKGWVIVL
jgi:hypothetical protein